VGGHTDSTGELDFNQRLSEDRASSVGNFLISQGIVAPRIQMVGFGPRNPVASNETKEGRSSNRRVELKLLPKEG
jgi:outer membrane protein OmpA-like peptidoglycan-associated protein